MADADEFVVLPPGAGLPEVAGLADRMEARCVTGVMLDVYPRRLEEFEQEGPFDPGPSGSSTESGISSSAGAAIRAWLYPGARARLMAELGLARGASGTGSTG